MRRTFAAPSPTTRPRIAQIDNAGIAERDSTFETRPREAADALAWLDSGERFPVLVAGAQEVCGWARIAVYSPQPSYAGVGEVSIYVDREARARAWAAPCSRSSPAGWPSWATWKLTGKLFPENEASVRLVRRNSWRHVGLHLRHGNLEGEWRDVLVVERLLR